MCTPLCTLCTLQADCAGCCGTSVAAPPPLPAIGSWVCCECGGERALRPVYVAAAGVAGLLPVLRIAKSVLPRVQCQSQTVHTAQVLESGCIPHLEPACCEHTAAGSRALLGMPAALVLRAPRRLQSGGGGKGCAPLCRVWASCYGLQTLLELRQPGMVAPALQAGLVAHSSWRRALWTGGGSGPVAVGWGGFVLCCARCRGRASPAA